MHVRECRRESLIPIRSTEEPVKGHLAAKSGDGSADTGNTGLTYSYWLEAALATCECGCNGETQRGEFIPGHDQKLRTAIETRVGGILALRDLIAAMEAYAVGQDYAEHMCQVVRRAFARGR